ncbi:MAG: two-component regulator propeller domain-containing protein [Rikenellaceae bacterium]
MLRVLLLLIIVLNGTLHLFANNIYSFTQISLKDGLSQSNVSVTLRDSYGRLWIGTRDGLNLHDGYCIKNFFHSHRDDTSLPANSVYDLTEAKDSTILIATAKGVVRYDERSDCFSPIYCDSKAVGFSNLCSVEGEIYVIGEDKNLSRVK